MKNKILIKNVRMINEGGQMEGDLLISKGRIEKMAGLIEDPSAEEMDGKGLFLLPGCIDDQVHFREPGLTHKAEIRTESMAAIAGGVTSYMEMPNTIPNALTKNLLEEKYQIAQKRSSANYSFFMGTSLDNYDEIMAIDYKTVCGIKIFMGSSTGGMLVDDPPVLERIFANAPALIATHCEDEHTILSNMERAKAKYGEHIPAAEHPHIRSREACIKSSELAIHLAKKHGARLHILHISTEDELKLFDASIPLQQKKISSEVCVHHMFFNDSDYEKKQHLIKCNPAIKSEKDRQALLQGLIQGSLDVVATDHAPHTFEEKQQTYSKAPSGLPLVQHPLLMMWTLAKETHWTMPFIVEKMCHAPATCFQIKERGFLREGYFADLILFDPDAQTEVRPSELFYKCGWSPLEGSLLEGKVKSCWINGVLAYDGNHILDHGSSMRLEFNRG